MYRRFFYCFLLTISSYCAIGQNLLDSKKISWISKNRDTLVLIDDELGHMIAYAWEISPIVKAKPIILFSSSIPPYFNNSYHGEEPKKYSNKNKYNIE